MALTLFHFSEDGKFFRRLDSIKENTGPLRTTVFIFDKGHDLIELFAEFKSEGNIITDFVKIEEDSEKVLYNCSLEKEPGDKTSVAYLIISKQKQIAILVSNQKREEWQ